MPCAIFTPFFQEEGSFHRFLYFGLDTSILVMPFACINKLSSSTLPNVAIMTVILVPLQCNELSFSLQVSHMSRYH